MATSTKHGRTYRTVGLGVLLVLAGAMSVGLSGAGCVHSCTLVGCVGGYGASVESGSGVGVTGFVATVSLAGAEASLTCPPADPQAPCVSVVAGAAPVTACCRDASGFYVEGVEDRHSELSLRVVASSGEAYEGSPAVTAHVQKDFNGPGCGDCTSYDAKIVLN